MEIKDVLFALSIAATLVLGLWNLRASRLNSKKTSFINTVTAERVKWLACFRKNISDFCGLTHTWTRSKVDGTEKELEVLGEIDKLRYLIRLQLNPKSSGSRSDLEAKIEDLISRIPDLTDHRSRGELDGAVNDLIVTSQALLKAEWEKVKFEAKNGDLQFEEETAQPRA